MSAETISRWDTLILLMAHIINKSYTDTVWNTIKLERKMKPCQGWQCVPLIPALGGEVGGSLLVHEHL